MTTAMLMFSPDSPYLWLIIHPAEKLALSMWDRPKHSQSPSVTFRRPLAKTRHWVRCYLRAEWLSTVVSEAVKPYKTRQNELGTESGCQMWRIRVLVPEKPGKLLPQLHLCTHGYDLIPPGRECTWIMQDHSKKRCFLSSLTHTQSGPKSSRCPLPHLNTPSTPCILFSHFGLPDQLVSDNGPSLLLEAECYQACPQCPISSFIKWLGRAFYSEL